MTGVLMGSQDEQCHVEKLAFIEVVGCLSWDFSGKISVDGVEGIPGK